MNDDATINENGGKFRGMDRYEARAQIVKELGEMGLLVRIEDYTHNVGTHDRCGTTVEPLIKQQWFVKMDELIKPAVKAVKEGDIRLIPKRMEKTYFNWFQLDRQHPRLVHQPPALVGPQDPRILLRRVR